MSVPSFPPTFVNAVARLLGAHSGSLLTLRADETVEMYHDLLDKHGFASLADLRALLEEQRPSHKRGRGQPLKWDRGRLYLLLLDYELMRHYHPELRTQEARCQKLVDSGFTYAKGQTAGALRKQVDRARHDADLREAVKESIQQILFK